MSDLEQAYTAVNSWQLKPEYILMSTDLAKSLGFSIKATQWSHIHRARKWYKKYKAESGAIFASRAYKKKCMSKHIHYCNLAGINAETR